MYRPYLSVTARLHLVQAWLQLGRSKKKKKRRTFLSQAQGIIKPGLSAAKRYVHIDGMKPLAKIVGEFARIAALFFLLPACILGS